MNMYDAIMQAADHIERHPDLFSFDCYEMPPNCGTPGCALGWIGAFSQIQFKYQGFIGVKSDVSPQALGIPSNEFYDRMDSFGLHWHRDASRCARNMRLYAAKYHAPVAIPNWNAMAANQTVAIDARSQELVS